MRTRSFWELDADDDALVDRLAAGLGRNAGRVLAYLLLRAEREDDPATNVHLEVGTRSNRTAVTDATSRLEARGVIERTTERSGDDVGRPRTAWRPTAGLEGTVARTYAAHATALLDLAAGLDDGPEKPDARADAALDDRRPEPDAEADPGSSTAPLRVALNWRPNALQVPIYAAIAGDWYDAFDVDVRLEHCDGSRRALERLGTDADLAVAGAATVVRAREGGDAVVPVAPLYQRATTVLYTVRERFGEPLRSVDQLGGRRIGMPPAAETRLLGRLFLARVVGHDGIEVVDTDGEERAALRAGRADVVTGSVADPRELEREGQTVDVLSITDHFPVYGPTIVAHERTLRDRPGALRGFLAGTTAGWAEARCDPRPAAEAIADAAADAASAGRIRRTFERAAPAFGESDAVRERGWGWHRPAMWERLRTALEQGGLLRDAA